jgi:hypothetical protein
MFKNLRGESEFSDLWNEIKRDAGVIPDVYSIPGRPMN